MWNTNTCMRNMWVATKQVVALYPCIQSISIFAQGIAQLVQELDPSKACGPDGIPTKLLRATSFAISPVLTLIFNASLVQGKLITEYRN